MLHALKEYANNRGLTWEPGFKSKTVRRLLVFKKEGTLFAVADMAVEKGSKGREFARCPHLNQQEIRAGGAGCRHFLVDGVDVVALFSKNDQADDKLIAKHSYFNECLYRASFVEPDLAAIAMALSESENLEKIQSELKAKKAKPFDLITFAMLDTLKPIIVERLSWQDWWRAFRVNLIADIRKRKSPKNGNGPMLCLLSNKQKATLPAYLQELKSLRHLNIRVDSVSEAGLRHLREMTWLHELGLGEGSINEMALADLKKALPDCRISMRPVPSQPPRLRPAPPSLSGKPLPRLMDFRIDLSPAESGDKMILVCFFDMQQRPSRNCIMQLAKQAQQLRQKGVTVVAVQASKVDENRLTAWTKENNIHFPAGMIADDNEGIHFTWGVESLPWLILTDKAHIVLAEGFGQSELNQKIKEIDHD